MEGAAAAWAAGAVVEVGAALGAVVAVAAAVGAGAFAAVGAGVGAAAGAVGAAGGLVGAAVGWDAQAMLSNEPTTPKTRNERRDDRRISFALVPESATTLSTLSGAWSIVLSSCPDLIDQKIGD